MSSKRIINARDIVIDIKRGKSDAELMEKYRLSAKGLESAFNKLVSNRILTVREIYGEKRRSLGDDTVIIDDVRELPRHYLMAAVSIHEESNPDTVGSLSNIHERGIGILGIPARIGEAKQFVIPAPDFVKVKEVRFTAKCIWSNPHRERENWETGFQITDISAEHMKRLRSLIEEVSLG